MKEEGRGATEVFEIQLPVLTRGGILSLSVWLVFQKHHHSVQVFSVQLPTARQTFFR